MKTFKHLPELIGFLWEESPTQSDSRIYFDPFPKHFDFDQEENPPSFYYVENMEDEINIPDRALLLGIGAFSTLLLIEGLLVKYYKEQEKEVKGNQISNKN